jgi:hypothetical protein
MEFAWIYGLSNDTIKNGTQNETLNNTGAEK